VSIFPSYLTLHDCKRRRFREAKEKTFFHMLRRLIACKELGVFTCNVCYLSAEGSVTVKNCDRSVENVPPVDVFFCFKGLLTWYLTRFQRDQLSWKAQLVSQRSQNGILFSFHLLNFNLCIQLRWSLMSSFIFLRSSIISQVALSQH